MTGSTSPIDRDDIVARDTFAPGFVVSGSMFERAELRDGRQVILKHLPAEGDWLTRLSDGFGRARALWDDGVLERVSAHADHAVLGMVREDSHDVVVMEDVGAYLLPRSARLPPTTVDLLLRGLAALHHAWEGHVPPGLCTVAARQSIAAPIFHQRDIGPHPCPFRGPLLEGWERFADDVPDDVVEAVFAVLDDPLPLGKELDRAASATLLHGDVKLGNLGLRDGNLVLIDWGELTGTGPPELDVTWFAATSTNPSPLRRGTWTLDAMPDDVVRAYEVQAGRSLDARALDLACIGALAQSGFILAGMAGRDSPRSARAGTLLEWWIARVRRALESWSPT